MITDAVTKFSKTFSVKSSCEAHWSQVCVASIFSLIKSSEIVFIFLPLLWKKMVHYPFAEFILLAIMGSKSLFSSFVRYLYFYNFHWFKKYLNRNSRITVDAVSKSGLQKYMRFNRIRGKFFTTTTETSQNSSKWSHWSTDYNKCLDLSIRTIKT